MKEMSVKIQMEHEIELRQKIPWAVIVELQLMQHFLVE